MLHSKTNGGGGGGNSLMQRCHDESIPRSNQIRSTTSAGGMSGFSPIA
jgi:hypothetical protein